MILRVKGSEEQKMAPKLATMLTENSHKIIVILAHAFLEWVLILLLLSNSVFSYMIRKFAIYFGLKKPCILCSTVDHLREPAKTTDSYKALLCEIHATEISNLGYCLNHRRFAESQNMCEECLSSADRKVLFCHTDSKEMRRCSCCEKNLTKMITRPHFFSFRGSVVIREIQEEYTDFKANDISNRSSFECEPQILSEIGSFSLRDEAAEYDSNEGGVHGHAVSGEKHMENVRNEDRIHSIDASGHLLLSSDEKKSGIQQSQSLVDVDQDIFYKFKQLKFDLEAEQKARSDLYSELEEERNAAAIAANQTLAMITRLQEEKSAMQMEALHYQRVMEEQSEYDQEALQLLNELVAKREKEKQELEKILEGYRERVLDFEEKEKAMTILQKGNANLCSSCSIDIDSDVLSIDQNRQYSKIDDNNEKNLSLMECSEEWGAIEDSLEELEEERMSIIKKLKELESKLQKGEIQNEELCFTNEKSTGLEDKCKNDLDLNAGLCSQEVNLVSSFPTNIPSETHPKTMGSVARKLLDIVESDDSTDTEDMTEMTDKIGCDKDIIVSRVENENIKRLAIEKEMDHVYERLQALEADTEFLRHCIASVNKGNEGVNLLQEILKHLRELRDAEICM